MFRLPWSRVVVTMAVVGLCVSIAILVAPAQQAVQPLPQPPGWGGGVQHHHYYGGAASAPGYSRPGYYGGGGNDFSGITNPAAARGQYNVDTAQAIQTLSQTQHQSIENHNYAVSSYYQNKEVHDQYEAAHRAPQLTPEQLKKIAEKAGPGRLSSTQLERATNVIQWPALLRDSDYFAVRSKLDQLFHKRTPDNSGADSDNYVEIHKNCEAMRKILDGKVRELPMPTFCAAEHFIRSVDYEGQFAVIPSGGQLAAK